MFATSIIAAIVGLKLFDKLLREVLQHYFARLPIEGLRFFGDCAPKKWPLRGSCSLLLRW